jgi:glycosyltransferase involved in cell wall biosynthesis
MTDFPDVAILVITYNRPKVLKETLYALQKNLNYPKDKLHVIVSDDSTGGTYLSSLKRTKAFKVWGKNGVDFRSTDKRSGWGLHVNNALDYVTENYPQCDYVFQIEDDYKLLKELNLNIGVGMLETRKNIGMLRYRGTAGTLCLYHQFQTDIKDYEPTISQISYLQLDNASSTLWVYSNGPHLKRLKATDKHPSFHGHYGRYAEGLKLGATEENFAHRVKDGMKLGNAPAIAILPDWVEMKYSFLHLGETWQHGKDDIGTGNGQSS